MSDLAAIKASARKTALARRKEAHEEVAPGAAQSALTEALGAFSGEVLAGYMPIRTEIDPLPVMIEWAQRSPVCVPVVTGKGQPLAFHAWTPSTRMISGAFGAMIPETGDGRVPRVLIVPLLAFDAAGYRLGYGGGFYDRTLAGLRERGDVTAIGLAYSAQQMPSVPREPTDQPLDMVVTEAGVLCPR